MFVCQCPYLSVVVFIDIDPKIANNVRKLDCLHLNKVLKFVAVPNLP